MNCFRGFLVGVAILLFVAQSHQAAAQQAPWFVVDSGRCQEAPPPSERVQALRRGGETAARALPYRPPGAAPDSEPSRFTVRRASGAEELFFRTQDDCAGWVGVANRPPAATHAPAVSEGPLRQQKAAPQAGGGAAQQGGAQEGDWFVIAPGTPSCARFDRPPSYFVELGRAAGQRLEYGETRHVTLGRVVRLSNPAAGADSWMVFFDTIEGCFAAIREAAGRPRR